MSQKVLYTYESLNITKREIINALREVGLKKGDTVLIHSDVSTFGKIGLINDRDAFLGELFDAFMDVIGKEGTVVVPTFTYSFCKNESFDVRKTKSTVGAFTEFVRKQKDAVRSEDPIFSHAGVGKKAEELLKKTGGVCFGANSFFDRFYKNGGKIINFGKFFDITFIHYIERKFGVDYRFDKFFPGKIILEEGIESSKEVTFYVRSLPEQGFNVIYDMTKLGNELERKNLLKRVNLGGSFILCSDIKDCYEVGLEMLGRDEYAFLEKNPHELIKTQSQNKIKEGVGHEMMEMIVKLFPICRSITGNGVRETLNILQKEIPIKIHEVPSGTQVFDWTVPKEWNIYDAYVIGPDGNKIIDFKENNLHVVGYSTPVNKTLSLKELQEHLHSLPGQPDAIPYITSYYKERWGFCIKHNYREKLKEGSYKVFIGSELKNGSLTYGELIIPGESKEEVFLSTYVCHPSMANDELSGPVVTTSLVKWILQKSRKYTYRIIFIPETIGSITYLNKNIEVMKKNIIAGFNISCVGDSGSFSYIPSRNGHTYADRIALNILSFKQRDFIRYSFLDKGSDERQYNAPGIDLPLCCILKSKYGTYPEYHTSLDNLDFVSSQGLSDSYEAFKECLKLIEKNKKYKIKCLGEPQLGKRGLYPTISTKSSTNEVKSMMNFISYADGTKDLIEISEIIKVPVWELYSIIKKLLKADLLSIE